MTSRPKSHRLGGAVLNGVCLLVLPVFCVWVSRIVQPILFLAPLAGAVFIGYLARRGLGTSWRGLAWRLAAPPLLCTAVFVALSPRKLDFPMPMSDGPDTIIALTAWPFFLGLGLAAAGVLVAAGSVGWAVAEALSRRLGEEGLSLGGQPLDGRQRLRDLGDWPAAQ